MSSAAISAIRIIFLSSPPKPNETRLLSQAKRSRQDQTLKLPFQVTDRVIVSSDYVPNNYTIELRVAPDGMKADIQLVPAAGIDVSSIFLTGEDIEVFLENAGIAFGINGRMISRMTKERIFNQWVTIARGKPPVMGQDATITFLFTAEPGELNLIQHVSKGDPLCDIQRASSGERGINVYGQEVPALDGKDLPIPKGEHVVLARNGSRLLADLDGMVFWDGKLVHVRPVFQVDRVDAGIGDIRFNGTVVVTGEVEDGYEIHAGKDIIIAKDVGAVFLECAGSLKIMGGIHGGQKGVIKAGGNVMVKYIHDAHVFAGGAVIVDDSICDSEVAASGPVMVKSTSGSISSGTVSSEAWIYAHSVGSENTPVRVRLVVGHDPMLPEKKAGDVEGIHATIKDFSKLYSSLIKLRRLKEKYALSKQQETLYAKILTAMSSLKSHLLTADIEIADITEKIRKVHAGFISIEGIVYKDAILQIGTAVKHIQQHTAATQFNLAGGQLVESEYCLKPEIQILLTRDRYDKA